MRRLVILAPCALVLLSLAGCQSEEEKRAERETLKREIIQELSQQVPGIVRTEFIAAVEQHKRELVERQAAEAAAKAAAAAAAKTSAGKTAVPVKPAPKKH